MEGCSCMERKGKALQAVCTAVMLCVLLLAAVSLQTKGERGVGIIALALCLLLEFIRYLLSRIVAFEQKEVRENKAKGIDDNSYANLEKLLREQGQEIEKLKCRISLQNERFKKWRKYLEKRLEEMEEKGESSIKKEEFSEDKAESKKEQMVQAALISQDEEFSEDKAESKKEQIVQATPVSLDTVELENKKELTRGDRFPVYKDGRGAYQLINSRELLPSFLKAGEIFTKESYEIFKAQNMGKIFTFNNREVIHHKILEIEPAKIMLTHSEEEEIEYYGILIHQGKIEVECVDSEEQ